MCKSLPAVKMVTKLLGLLWGTFLCTGIICFLQFSAAGHCVHTRIIITDPAKTLVTFVLFAAAMKEIEMSTQNPNKFNFIPCYFV